MLTKVSAESKLLEFQNEQAFSMRDELPKFCSPQSNFLLGVCLLFLLSSLWQPFMENIYCVVCTQSSHKLDDLMWQIG